MKSSKPIYFRVIALFLLVLCILFLPWWITALVAFFLVLYFDYYLEVLFAGLLYDSIYSAPVAKFGNFEFIATVFTIGILLFSLFIKKRLLFYNR